MRRLKFILPSFRHHSKIRRRLPSGLLSLAAEVCAVGGIEVEVIDAESAAWSATKVVEHLQEEKPDVIGISICSPAFQASLELIQEIRSKISNVLIILGGKHITHCWQTIIREGINVDALVRGEGESVVAVLAQVLSNGASMTEILAEIAKLPNVWVQGKLFDPILPPPVDLNQAQPWPFETLNPGLKYYHGDRMLVEFSRGCPGRCSYCLASRDHQGLSFRPTFQVLDTLAFLCNVGFSSFFFTDDDFAASPQLLKPLLNGIVERGLSIEFDANVRPDSLVRCAELAPLFRLAGCRCLWLGIESGSPTILKSYKKGFSIDICENAVATAFSAATMVKTNWILGSPLETEETVQASLYLAKRLRRIGPHVPHISFLIPYPGTPICNEALALKLIAPSRLNRMSDTTHGTPVMPSKYLSTIRLKELFGEFHKGYFDSVFFNTVSMEIAEEAKLVLQSASIVSSG